MKVKIFLAFSAQDSHYAHQFERHLLSVEQEGLCELWSWRRLEAGTSSQAEIEKHLQAANIILLLITADLLSESPQLIQAVTAPVQGTVATSMPILLRHISLSGTSLEGLVLFPRNRRPISGWEDPDEAWSEIVEELRRIIARLRRSSEVVPQGEGDTAHNRLSNRELRQQILSLVHKIRDLLAVYRRELCVVDSHQSQPGAADSTQWHEQWQQSDLRRHHLTDDLLHRYNRDFKVDAWLLRKEIERRLSTQLGSLSEFDYMHPTKPLHLTAIADDLERFARSLSC